MNKREKSIWVTAVFACLIAATSAAHFPQSLARSARAAATSEYSGQYCGQLAVHGNTPEAGSEEDLSQAWCVRGDTLHGESTKVGELGLEAFYPKCLV